MFLKSSIWIVFISLLVAGLVFTACDDDDDDDDDDNDDGDDDDDDDDDDGDDDDDDNDDNGDDDDDDDDDCDVDDICEFALDCGIGGWGTVQDCIDASDEMYGSCPDPGAYIGCVCDCIISYPDCNDWENCIIECAALHCP